MAEEKMLLRKRESFKGRLSMFKTHVEQLEPSSLDRKRVGELQLRLDKIEELYGQYDGVQVRLECMSESIEGQLSERTKFESMYYNAVSYAHKLLSDAASESVQNIPHKSTSAVKLPTIHLPKFSGSYENWLEFRDTFTSLIHSNPEIENISKFHYLRASLDGSAATVIKSIELSSVNYDLAWQLLCDRFNNKRLLVQNHVTSLFSVEVLGKESSTHLKHLIDVLNKNLRALESLGEPVKQWDTLLIHIITKKLDSKTYREWEEFRGRTSEDERVTFDSFIAFLRSRADLIETLEMSSKNNSVHINSQPTPKLRAMVTVQQPVSKSNSQSPALSCPNCKESHYLFNCPQFLALNIRERYQLLPSLRVCFNCYCKGHFSNQCRKRGCSICKRKHNTLSHIDDFKADYELEPSVSPRTVNCDAQRSGGQNVVLTSNIRSMYCKEQSNVLLSTALIKLYDNNHRAYVVRAVLDSGSTASFITKGLAKKLNLPVVASDRSVVGINNIKSHVGEACNVKMTSVNNIYSFDVHCFVLPTIVDKIPRHNIKLSDLNIPPGITLADPEFVSPDSVDVLLGADQFWNIIGSHKMSLGDGKPLLVNTKLGWVVSGPYSNCTDSTLHSENSLECN